MTSDWDDDYDFDEVVDFAASLKELPDAPDPIDDLEPGDEAEQPARTLAPLKSPTRRTKPSSATIAGDESGLDGLDEATAANVQAGQQDALGAMNLCSLDEAVDACRALADKLPGAPVEDCSDVAAAIAYLRSRGAYAQGSNDLIMYRWITKWDNPGYVADDPRTNVGKGEAAMLIIGAIPEVVNDEFGHPTDRWTIRFDYQINPLKPGVGQDGTVYKYISNYGSGSPIEMQLSHLPRISKARVGLQVEGTWKRPSTCIWSPEDMLVCSYRGVGNWKVRSGEQRVGNPIFTHLAEGMEAWAICPDGDWRTNHAVRYQSEQLLTHLRTCLPTGCAAGIFPIPNTTTTPRKKDQQ